MPLQAQFAGQISFVDKIPLLAHHRVFVNKALAHPFRIGYWNEAERRLLLTYGALYAHDPNDIVKFAEENDVQYLVYSTLLFRQLDGRLFVPIKGKIDAVYKKNKPLGFALENLPASVMEYTRAEFRVVNVAKLKEAIASGEVVEPQPRPEEEAPFIGPRLMPQERRTLPKARLR
jgi:hypothetical protein